MRWMILTVQRVLALKDLWAVAGRSCTLLERCRVVKLGMSMTGPVLPGRMWSIHSHLQGQPMYMCIPMMLQLIAAGTQTRANC